MASVRSPLFYISAVDYGSTGTTGPAGGAADMRLPPAGLAGTRLPPAAAAPAPGRPTTAPVSAVTVAKALSVVQTNPVK